MFGVIRRHSTRIGFLLFAASLALALGASAGCGQSGASYPTKPVDLVVGAAPGGGADILSRMDAEFLQKKWNQPVNVVNKAGAGGTVGIQSVLQSAADGYTIATFMNSGGFLNPAVQKNHPYKWDTPTHIALIAIQPVVFVVKGDSKYGSLQDLARDLKQDPTKLSFGSSGPSGPSTFATAQLAEALGVDPNKLKAVAFASGAPALTAVAGGHVDFAAQTLPEVLELVRGGQLKALAIATPARSKALPNVPTTGEAGFAAVDHTASHGIIGPPNLPENVIKKWDDALAEAVKDPNFADQVDKAGATPMYLNSKDFHSWVGNEYNKAVTIVNRLGLAQ